MKKIYIILLLGFVLGCEVFTIEDISEENITAIAPLENAALEEGDVNFSWEELEDADAYTIQIATPSFEEANEIIADSTTTALSFIQTLETGNYEWRVKGSNTEFETVYTSSSFIVIEGTSLENVTLTAPAADSEMAPGAITFSWEIIAAADSYELQIATPGFDSDTFEVITNITLETNSHINQLEAGSYQWRVKGISATKTSDYTTQNLTIIEKE